MKNLRSYTYEEIPGLKFLSNRNGVDAVFRKFGNSAKFAYAECTRDLSKADGLSDVGLLWMSATSEIVDQINSIDFNDISFSRMVGNTLDTNPFGVSLSKGDIVHCLVVMHEQSPQV